MTKKSTKALPAADTTPTLAPAQDVALPARIELVRPHSFIDDTGLHRMWNQGQVVADPAEIALLFERKACVKEL